MSFGPKSLYSIKIEEPETNNSSWFPSFSLFVDSEPYHTEFEKFVRDGHTYYVVPHKSEYRVRMTNDSGSRVNATLKVDGTKMGIWRIEPYSDILIERPSHNNRKFTFVKEDSSQAKMGGVVKRAPENGLVEVSFVPEMKREMHFNSSAVYNSYDSEFNDSSFSASNSSIGTNKMMAHNWDDVPDMTKRDIYSRTDRGGNMTGIRQLSAGATVLGDNSNQKFNSADYMEEDLSKKVTKRVRLVVKEDRQPFVSIRTKSSCYEGLYDDVIPPRIDNERTKLERPRCPHTDCQCGYRAESYGSHSLFNMN